MSLVQPILAAPLLAPLNDELVTLLCGIRDEEWSAPTSAGAWTVKDVTAHLLDTSLRRLSTVPIPDFEPNRVNREWIVAMQRVSPRILIELIDRYGREQAELLSSLDPFAKAQWGVAWAGEEESLNWFDVARELTERWHHQEQIRDALGREPLFEPYLGPVIDTFMRGVPHAYRGVSGAVAIRIGADAWTLRDGQLFAGEDKADAIVTIEPDSAWRLFTKSKAKTQPIVEGDVKLAEPLLRMICVIG